MRILILSQYFTPEVGATSTRVHSFAAGLAARGHDVEVICEIPNHPQGVVHDGYRGRVVRRQRLDGFRGHWVWVRTRPEKTTCDRLTFYGSYLAMATRLGFAARPPGRGPGVLAAVAGRRSQVLCSPAATACRSSWTCATCGPRLPRRSAS